MLSLANGSILYTYSTAGFIYSSAAFSTGQFFINSTDGKLYAFGAVNGSLSPTVNSVQADQGALGTTNVVTLNGDAFNGATDVLFGSTDIPSSNTFPCVGTSGGCFDVLSDAQIEVDTPTTLTAGPPVNVVVVTPGGPSQQSSADLYTTVAPGAYTPLIRSACAIREVIRRHLRVRGTRSAHRDRSTCRSPGRRCHMAQLPSW